MSPTPTSTPILGQQDIHVHCKITVDGERLKVDFDGSDNRQEIAGWSTFGNTRGYVIAQLASLVDPSIPKNQGFFECIDLHVPLGCCLNPTEGKPVAAAPTIPVSKWATPSPWPCPRSSPTVAPPRPTSTAAPVRCGGTSIRGPASRSSTMAVRPTPAGSTPFGGVDGWGALAAASGNLIKASAEINENLYPHFLRGRNYITDSGGAGRWRGGCGVAVRQGGAGADLREPVRRQPVPHPSRDRRGATMAPLTAAPEGGRAGGSGRQGHPRSPACCSRRASASSTTSVEEGAGATRCCAIPSPCWRTSGTSTCRSKGPGVTTAWS